MKYISTIIVLFVFVSHSAWSSQLTSLRILTTTDLHSHMRPTPGPFRIGGYAPLASAIARAREENRATLVLDGGDWSEGSIYYFDGAGEESLRMLDRLGIQGAVLGNHDWLNGPDILTSLLKTVQPRVKILGANLDFDSYKGADFLSSYIKPFEIFEIGGLKIGVLGLCTYEFVFDRFLQPITITNPLFAARKYSEYLKRQEKVDFVIAVSHNSGTVNRWILKFSPDVDLLIGGHDHHKMEEPFEVERKGERVSWMVQSGKWGHYLGQLDLEFSNEQYQFKKWRLIPIDDRLDKDPAIEAAIVNTEIRLESKLGPIFHLQLGESQSFFDGSGMESAIGNLVADSYVHSIQKKRIPVDFALDSNRYIYGNLYPGQIHASDVLNLVPAIFNPLSGQTWSLRTIPLQGKTIQFLLKIIFSSSWFSTLGFFNFSGMEIIFDPWLMFGKNELEPSIPFPYHPLSPSPLTPVGKLAPSGVLRKVLIHGEPLDETKTYWAGVPDGIVEGFQFVNNHIKEIFPLDQMRDTGIQRWEAFSEWVKASSPLNQAKVIRRIRTLQSDLQVKYDDICWEPIERSSTGIRARIRVRVTNVGASPSPYGHYSGGPQLHLFVHEPTRSKDPELLPEKWVEALPERPILALAPGKSDVDVWEVDLPNYSGKYAVTARITGTVHEINPTNKSATHWWDDPGDSAKSATSCAF